MSDKSAARWQGLLGAVVVVTLVCWQAGLIDFWLTLLILAPAGSAATYMLRCVERRYREYVFERLEPAALPSACRKFFSKHTPTLEKLGFQCVGDFRLLPPPIPELVRVFASPGGKCFANIIEHFNVRCVGFVSMTTDGVYLESATLEASSEGPDPSVPLRFQFLGNIALVEALQKHRQFVLDYEAQHDTEVLACQPDEFRFVLEYGHRLAGWDLYRKGRRRTAPPPLPEFPLASPDNAIADHSRRDERSGWGLVATSDPMSR
jgi:hypothetical protein